MGILQLYPADEFYASVDPIAFSPGQLCRIVTPQIDPIPRILDVQRSSPEEHEDIKFFLRNANKPGDFKSADRTLPLKYLRLRAHEELLVQQAKKRPGIILSSPLDAFSEISSLLKTKGKKHLQEDSLFVAPCYGIESRSDPQGFPPEMVVRIRHLIYRQFFYLPPASPALTEEGIVRFDRIQVVVGRHQATIEPSALRLSDEVFSVFLSLCLFCISGVEDANLAAARTLLKDAYPTP